METGLDFSMTDPAIKILIGLNLPGFEKIIFTGENIIPGLRGQIFNWLH